MKIGILGAGFTGLSSAHNLLKKGHQVFIFDNNSSAGGLAGGFKPARNASRSDAGGEENWTWILEQHYHHIFTSDNSIKNLAKEIGIPIYFKKPKTKSLIDEKIYPLDSPFDVITFKKLTLIERTRLGLVLTYLKLSPFQKWMEKISARDWLKKKLGKNIFELLWEPLLSAKFGEYKNDIPLSWFWARIKKRSQKLGYPEGGFQNLADALKKNIEKKGGKFYLQTEVKEIKSANNKVKISFDNKEEYFDKVIVTTSSSAFLKVVRDIPKEYLENLEKLKALSALTLVLIFEKPFLTDGTYWLNICRKDFPFLSVVEHTNFIDKKYYNNKHIAYVGKYLPINHPYMKMSADQILKIYDPYLRKINPNYTLDATNYTLFKASFAQPVITLNYSKIIPSLETPVKNIYLANMQQVYPWDRGVNYAIELGEKVAKKLLNSQT